MNLAESLNNLGGWLNNNQGILALIIGAPPLIWTFIVFLIKKWNLVISFFIFVKDYFDRHKKFNVLLSLDFNKENEGYHKELTDSLVESINHWGLEKEVRILDLSKKKIFKSKEEVKRYKEANPHLDLIIWGRYTNSNLKRKNKKITVPKISFTYTKSDDTTGELGRLIDSEVQNAVFTKQYWEIVENRSFDDIEIIKNNLLDLSIYIVALSLILKGDIEKCFNVLDHYVISTKGKKDYLSSGVRFRYINVCELLTMKYVHNEINLELSAKYAKKGLEYKPDSLVMLTNLSLCQYKANDFAGLDLTIAELKKYYPDNIFTLINEAFVLVLKKKYNEAILKYRNLRKLGTVDSSFDPLQVAEFLEEESHKDTSDPALKYILAVINELYIDKIVARKLYLSFIRDASPNSHGDLYLDARKKVS